MYKVGTGVKDPRDALSTLADAILTHMLNGGSGDLDYLCNIIKRRSREEILNALRELEDAGYVEEE
ncbi:hypothetical protein GF360_03670 [candidate division WWE3 bacterium]|nr:hypothetical protein [candidate division WWE3 bacterium]